MEKETYVSIKRDLTMKIDGSAAAQTNPQPISNQEICIHEKGQSPFTYKFLLVASHVQKICTCEATNKN